MLWPKAGLGADEPKAGVETPEPNVADPPPPAPNEKAGADEGAGAEAAAGAEPNGLVEGGALTVDELFPKGFEGAAAGVGAPKLKDGLLGAAADAEGVAEDEAPKVKDDEVGFDASVAAAGVGAPKVNDSGVGPGPPDEVGPAGRSGDDSIPLPPLSVAATLERAPKGFGAAAVAAAEGAPKLKLGFDAGGAGVDDKDGAAEPKRGAGVAGLSALVPMPANGLPVVKAGVADGAPNEKPIEVGAAGAGGGARGGVDLSCLAGAAAPKANGLLDVVLLLLLLAAGTSGVTVAPNVKGCVAAAAVEVSDGMTFETLLLPKENPPLADARAGAAVGFEGKTCTVSVSGSSIL